MYILKSHSQLYDVNRRRFPHKAGHQIGFGLAQRRKGAKK